MVFTPARHDGTSIAAITGAASFRIGNTIATVMVDIAFIDKRLLAFGMAAGNAIEFVRVTLRQTRVSTWIRAAWNRFTHAAAIASRLEVERRAVERTFGGDADFAINAGLVEVEVATLGRRRDRKR